MNSVALLVASLLIVFSLWIWCLVCRDHKSHRVAETRADSSQLYVADASVYFDYRANVTRNQRQANDNSAAVGGSMEAGSYSTGDVSSGWGYSVDVGSMGCYGVGDSGGGDSGGGGGGD